jgi:hypothetical protein
MLTFFNFFKSIARIKIIPLQKTSTSNIFFCISIKAFALKNLAKLFCFPKNEMFATQFLRYMKMYFRSNLGGGGRGGILRFSGEEGEGVPPPPLPQSQPWQINVEAVYQTKKSEETLSCQPLLQQSVCLKHELINYIDTNAKGRHLKKLTAQGIF